jgi:lipopolysaccharide/colanic/teichoic acid biosynthesis glycosyltransferase
VSSVSKSSEIFAERQIPVQTGTLTRLFDFLCALIGLIFLLPVFALIALAIVLEDRGTILYSQDRIGKNFRRFRFYKFRSMVPGADRHGFLTAYADPRVTRVGYLLRRYKLDELPQLVNVLKGDMQLVGPRPEIGGYVEKFPQYTILLQDRPGITDPASLAFRREDRILCAERLEQQYLDEVLPAKLALSLDYQKRRTLFSDLKILVQTILRLFE